MLTEKDLEHRRIDGEMERWVHRDSNTWITRYPHSADGELFIAYQAVAKVPRGRQPWTVDNRRLTTIPSRTLSEALAVLSAAIRD